MSIPPPGPEPEFPVLPPLAPRVNARWRRWLGVLMQRLTGWRIAGNMPDISKVLLIVAPHTSNWDFLVGISAVWALGLRVRFLGKHTLFRPPLGWLMRWSGGVPVNREAPQGLVPQAVEAIRDADAIFLAITPAGTRSSTRPWKSGFYHIAHAAGVPILPVAFDGARRTIRLLEPFETSGDFASEIPRLRALYDGVRGINP
jgi:1-acyl-sn-glycerol-3-phosphate acyltransferase